MKGYKKNKKGKPFIILAVAVLVLVGLSFVPWSKLTGGYIKDFNLFSDLFGISGPVTATEQLDPELSKALAHEEAAQDPVPGDGSVTTPTSPEHVKPVAASRENGDMIIEDYTANSQGVAHLKAALRQRASRPVRIAVIGDSYIEGDILTMDIREQLQDKFGGCGVGYMPVSSPLTGFRVSVTQTCKGWTEHDIRKNAKDAYKSLAGEYFTGSTGAHVSYKGVSKLRHLDSWDMTKVLCIAPAGGRITVTTDDGDHQFELGASSDSVQCVEVKGRTTSASLSGNTSGMQLLGMYLDGNSGILVDNMSLRGNSGITHRKLNVDLAKQMRKHVDYDLIIVEYGINALSSQQKDYSGYRKLMEQTLARIKECYPASDVILLGIGDRGQKINGEVVSVPTSQNMVDAQRDAARNAGVLFWDTREAMGGEGAVMAWREKGMINPDYIHLNAKGGAELAKLFVGSLMKATGE